jgi:general secretion pathway protein G
MEPIDKTKPPLKRRFSLGMILIAIIILVYLTVCIFLPMHRSTELSYVVKAQIGALKSALDFFKADNDFYPQGTNGLRDLVFQPSGTTNWHQWMEKIPLDPWDHPYLYECPGKHNTNGYDLSSAGPDGVPGTADDITNWELPKK